MSRQYHHLKTETEYYQAVEQGLKRFECRFNDRNFQRLDIVTLEEVVKGVPTGRKIEALVISYVLTGPQFGIAEGYCVFCWDEPPSYGYGSV